MCVRASAADLPPPPAGGSGVFARAPRKDAGPGRLDRHVRAGQQRSTDPCVCGRGGRGVEGGNACARAEPPRPPPALGATPPGKCARTRERTMALYDLSRKRFTSRRTEPAGSSCCDVLGNMLAYSEMAVGEGGRTVSCCAPAITQELDRHGPGLVVARAFHLRGETKTACRVQAFEGIADVQVMNKAVFVF